MDELAEWGQRASDALLSLIGIRRHLLRWRRTPSPATIGRVLGAVDGDALERAVGAKVPTPAAPGRRPVRPAATSSPAGTSPQACGEEGHGQARDGGCRPALRERPPRGHQCRGRAGRRVLPAPGRPVRNLTPRSGAAIRLCPTIAPRLVGRVAGFLSVRAALAWPSEAAGRERWCVPWWVSARGHVLPDGKVRRCGRRCSIGGCSARNCKRILELRPERASADGYVRRQCE